VHQRFEHPALGLVADSSRLGPSGGDIHCVKGAGELASGIAAVMLDKIDLNEPGPGVVPFGERPYGNLAFEQAAGFSAGSPLERKLLAVGLQSSVDRRGAYGHQFGPNIVIYADFAVLLQDRDYLRQKRSKPLAG